jgi:dTDP-4-amino-4,6-dideoxygalactose transaminase
MSANPLGFRWLHEGFGTNWRLIEMQGVIGRIQLARMGGWHAACPNAVMGVARGLLAFARAEVPAHIDHAWYKAYAFRPDALKTGWTRAPILADLNARGVPGSSVSCSEVYMEKAFDGTGLRPEQPLPVARELGETSLMFLVRPTLTPDEIALTCSTLKNVVTEAML